MLNFVNLNGEIVPAEEARISVYDHGFLYGDGIFETMRSYEGQVYKLKEHLERLERSAKLIELNFPWSKEDLSQEIVRLLEANQLLTGDAYIRLSISRGEGPIGIDPNLCPKPTLVITAKKLGPYSEETYGQGQKIIFVKTKRNLAEALNPEIKSFNFLNNILAKIELNKAKVAEGLMLNFEGYVTEGTVSNVFMVKNDRLLTPVVEVGILEGITRNMVIQLAKKEGMEVVEGKFTKDDFYSAQEVFLTNSSGELMPVVQVDDVVIGNGMPGKVTLGLLEIYRELARGK